MEYTEHKYRPDDIGRLVAEKTAALKEGRGTEDLIGFGLGVVMRRLNANPRRYLDYGPYWWALKHALLDAGYSLGDESDPVVESEYTGSSPVETLVMAEQFRDMSLAVRPVGANLFTLSDDVDYVLFDADMESRL